MLRLVCALLLACMASAHGAEKTAWYKSDEMPLSIKAALAADKEFLGANNPGYSMKANARLCAPLRTVAYPCDYNSRATLSMFLTVHGKGLFPAAAGTSPRYAVYDPGSGFPDDSYDGTKEQNEMLRRAVLRNAVLFKNGDLSAQDVKQHWR